MFEHNNFFKGWFVLGLMALDEKIVTYIGKVAKLVINEDRCKGCANCVVVCPKDVLEMSPGGKDSNRGGYPYVRVVRIDDCVGCGGCAVICGDV